MNILSFWLFFLVLLFFGIVLHFILPSSLFLINFITFFYQNVDKSHKKNVHIDEVNPLIYLSLRELKFKIWLLNIIRISYTGDQMLINKKIIHAWLLSFIFVHSIF